MRLAALIAFFGALGVLSRFGVDRLAGPSQGFPVSTFSINLLGSFLLGFLYVMGTERQLLTPEVAAALGIGFLGGFTTFSSFALQSLLLAEGKDFSSALAYFILSPALGLLAAKLGLGLGRFLA